MRKEVQIIINYKNHIVNTNAMAFEYDGWNDEFKLKEIRDAYIKFITENVVDWRKFTKSELVELGFNNWDDDLVLMPLWAFHICESGLTLTSISGDKSIKGENKIDTDVRYGCIAHGFTVKELLRRDRKMKLDEIEK